MVGFLRNCSNGRMIFWSIGNHDFVGENECTLVFSCWRKEGTPPISCTRSTKRIDKFILIEMMHSVIDHCCCPLHEPCAGLYHSSVKGLKRNSIPCCDESVSSDSRLKILSWWARVLNAVLATASAKMIWKLKKLKASFEATSNKRLGFPVFRHAVLSGVRGVEVLIFNSKTMKGELYNLQSDVPVSGRWNIGQIGYYRNLISSRH
ncbi:hypothetical protein Tco_1133735 [Tanacetum coccineum]